MSAPPLANAAAFRIYSPAAAAPYRPWQPTLAVANDVDLVPPRGAPDTRPETDVPPRPVAPAPSSAANPSEEPEPAPVSEPASTRAIPAELERALADVLARPRLPDETIELAYRRKEHDVLALLAGLSRGECRDLRDRLHAARPDDALAAHFARLTADRRGRILAYLDEPRRHQLRAARTREATP